MNTKTHNKVSDRVELENELDEQIELTHSIIRTLYAEMSSHIENPNKRQFLGILPRQMEEVEMLYHSLYHPNQCEPKTGRFIMYNGMSAQALRVEWAESAYILNSMSDLIYDALDDEIQDHFLNNLALVRRCTKKLVRLIESVNYMVN